MSPLGGAVQHTFGQYIQYKNALPLIFHRLVQLGLLSYAAYTHKPVGSAMVRCKFRQGYIGWKY